MNGTFQRASSNPTGSASISTMFQHLLCYFTTWIGMTAIGQRREMKLLVKFSHSSKLQVLYTDCYYRLKTAA